MTYAGLQRPTAAVSATAVSAHSAPSDAALPAAGGTHGGPVAARRTNVPRIALWVVLALSAIGNMVASIAGAGIGPHVLFGAVSALSAVTLGVGFLRARR